MSRDNIARGLAVAALRGRVLAQSAVSASHTGDTAEATLATVTVPANSMGVNGRLAIRARFSRSGSGNATFKVKFGGTSFDTWGPLSNATSVFIILDIANRNAVNSQDGASAEARSNATVNHIATAGSIDTTTDQTVTFTGTLASGADSLAIESYQVVLYPMN